MSFALFSQRLRRVEISPNDRQWMPRWFTSFPGSAWERAVVEVPPLFRYGKAVNESPARLHPGIGGTFEQLIEKLVAERSYQCDPTSPTMLGEPKGLG